MRKKETPQFVVCLNNEGFPASLEVRKIYRMIPDKDAMACGDLRVVDESGEDYLYPAGWFASIKLPQEIVESLMRVA